MELINNIMKKILITGGAGFIGSHVVQLLKSKSKKVAIIDKITNRELIDQQMAARGDL